MTRAFSCDQCTAVFTTTVRSFTPGRCHCGGKTISLGTISEMRDEIESLRVLSAATIAALRAELATACAALEKLATLGRDEAESDAMNTVIWAGETARDAVATIVAMKNNPRRPSKPT